MANPAGDQQEAEIQNAVRNLLSCIRQRSSGPAEPQAGTSGISQHVRPNTVQQEMQRSFPAIFTGKSARFKRKAPDAPRPTRLLELQFCLLANNSSRTPGDESVLLQAGLGRRTVTLADDADHAEISKVLLEEYSKLRNLQGGWLLQKATGGSGQRKMTPLPQSSNGYSSKILKSSSNNGKNTIYIVPLQETLDTTPLPYDAQEFEKMPKNDCMTCGTSVPLQLLPFHIESCQYVNLEPGAGEKNDEGAVTICMDSCPICGEMFSTDIMPLHASSCGESTPTTHLGFPQMDYMTPIPVEPITSQGVPMSNSVPESSSNSSLLAFETPQSRSSEPPPAMNDAWKRAEDPERASVLYRRYMLEQKEDEPTLKVKLDLRESVEEQEERLIGFYKGHKVDWARPLHCRLEGDIATGEGVKRHFFSLVMQKLQTGFSLDFGNRTGTLLFEGQADHLTPSTSKVLLQSDLFKMAGRMIGHSFLHGGPPLAGISPAILHVLLGGSQETAPIVLEDVADIDIRETIELLTTTDKTDICTITEDQREAVDHLALSWDLPVLTTTNRAWLLQSLLQYAVLGRTSQQVHQLREGLKEAMLWPLLEARPDVLALVFPCQKMAECSAQMVLQNIIWPEDEEQNEDGCSVAVKSLVAGYLRKFVETVTEHKRKQLVKFWVGWEKPMQDMQVEVKPADHPTSSTCFHILRLPSHYTSYDEFQYSLECCIASNDYGFGLI